MNYYKYLDIGDYGQPLEQVVSEEEILDTYWLYWKERMIAKFGEDSELITPENCIEDWTVIHFALPTEK